MSLAMPLFDLQIYFGKVSEHDSYFRGKGLGTWPPLILASAKQKSKAKMASR